MRTLATVDLVVVDSRKAALASLGEALPAVILVSAMLPPRDEAAVAAYLRTRKDSSHVEMVTIPLLDSGTRPAEKPRGLLGRFKKKKNDENEGRVSLRQFASEIRKHIERVREAQAAIVEAEPEPEVESDVAEPGATVERLPLLPEFTAAEAALSERIARFMFFNHPSIAHTHGIEHDGLTRRLILVSDRVPGTHVSAMLARGSQHSIVADLPAAFYVIRRLLSAIRSLHAATGVAHVGIAPERLIVSPRAEVVIVAAALAAANAKASQDPRVDIARIAHVGMSLMLGRMVDATDDAAAQRDLLNEVIDVAAIRVNDHFSTVLRSWFSRALATDAGDAFRDFREAGIALTSVERAGCAGSRRALKAFVRDLAFEGVDSPEAAALEADRIRSTRARQFVRRKTLSAGRSPVDDAVGSAPDPPYRPAEISFAGTVAQPSAAESPLKPAPLFDADLTRHDEAPWKRDRTDEDHGTVDPWVDVPHAADITATHADDVEQPIETEAPADVVVAPVESEPVYEIVADSVESEAVYQVAADPVESEPVYEIVADPVESESLYEIVADSVATDPVLEIVEDSVEIDLAAELAALPMPAQAPEPAPADYISLDAGTEEIVEEIRQRVTWGAQAPVESEGSPDVTEPAEAVWTIEVTEPAGVVWTIEAPEETAEIVAEPRETIAPFHEPWTEEVESRPTDLAEPVETEPSITAHDSVAAYHETQPLPVELAAVEPPELELPAVELAVDPPAVELSAEETWAIEPTAEEPPVEEPPAEPRRRSLADMFRSFRASRSEVEPEPKAIEAAPPAIEVVATAAPILDEVVAAPIFDEVAAEPIVDEVVAQPIVDEVAAEPIVDEVVAQPIVEEAVAEPIFDEVVAEPIVEEVVAEPIVEEVVAEPIFDEVVAEPIVEEAVAEPIFDEVVAEPIVEEVVAEPIAFEYTAESYEEAQPPAIDPPHVEAPRDASRFDLIRSYRAARAGLVNAAESVPPPEYPIAEEPAAPVAAVDAYEAAAAETNEEEYEEEKQEEEVQPPAEDAPPARPWYRSPAFDIIRSFRSSRTGPADGAEASPEEPPDEAIDPPLRTDAPVETAEIVEAPEIAAPVEIAAPLEIVEPLEIVKAPEIVEPVAIVEPVKIRAMDEVPFEPEVVPAVVEWWLPRPAREIEFELTTSVEEAAPPEPAEKIAPDPAAPFASVVMTSAPIETARDPDPATLDMTEAEEAAFMDDFSEEAFETDIPAAPPVRSTPEPIEEIAPERAASHAEMLWSDEPEIETEPDEEVPEVEVAAAPEVIAQPHDDYSWEAWRDKPEAINPPEDLYSPRESETPDWLRDLIGRQSSSAAAPSPAMEPPAPPHRDVSDDIFAEPAQADASGQWEGASILAPAPEPIAEVARDAAPPHAPVMRSEAIETPRDVRPPPVHAAPPAYEAPPPPHDEPPHHEEIRREVAKPVAPEPAEARPSPAASIVRLFRRKASPAAATELKPAATPRRAESDTQRIRGPVTRPTAVEQPRVWPKAVAAMVVAAGLVAAGYAYYSQPVVPGIVVIESTPKGSEVFVDGSLKGRTPLKLELPAGKHQLELRRNGAVRELTLDVAAGAQLSQKVDWSTVKSTGSLIVTSEPPGGKVVVDGKFRGSTPLTIPDLPTGPHTVVVQTPQGSVHRTVQIKAGSEARLDESISEGWLLVFAPFELRISEGKRLVGTTESGNESGKMMLSSGRHELVLTNAALGYREVRVIDVNPGETISINIKAAEGIVRIHAPAGTEVSIDGQVVGTMPLGEVRVAAGSREVLLKHPQLGERKFTIDVTLSAPVSVNFK